MDMWLFQNQNCELNLTQSSDAISIFSIKIILVYSKILEIQKDGTLLLIQKPLQIELNIFVVLFLKSFLKDTIVQIIIDFIFNYKPKY